MIATHSPGSQIGLNDDKPVGLVQNDVQPSTSSTSENVAAQTNIDTRKVDLNEINFLEPTKLLTIPVNIEEKVSSLMRC